MHINTEPVKEWFGYSRQERRASLVLLILIAAVIIFRISIPENSMTITDLTPELTADAGNYKLPAESPFFDPNTASLDTLLLAGLDEHEAATLLNYRKKGGRFHNPSDIRKLYGLDSSKASAVIPYIIIKQDFRHIQERKTKIEINSCDSAALESLPGIGPVLAVRIIKYRNLLGGYMSVNQLQEVYGLSEQTFISIRSMLEADTSSVRKISINNADYSELSRLPYLDGYQVKAIMKYRQLSGIISGIDELRANRILPDSTLEKVRPYLDFSADKQNTE